MRHVIAFVWIRVTLASADVPLAFAPDVIFTTAKQSGRGARGGSTGSGLALSITKAIIERHGGTIRATSQPGRTTFMVLLPQSSAI